MITINGEEKDYKDIIDIPEDADDEYIDRYRQNLKRKYDRDSIYDDYSTVSQIFDEAMVERQLNRDLKNVFDAVSCPNIDEMRKIISGEIYEKATTAIKKIGAIKQFNMTGNKKGLQIVAINNLINHIFKIIDKVITDYPNEARLILNGEFKIFSSESIPLLAVLKLMRELYSKLNGYLYLDLDIDALQRKVISYAETLDFPSSLNKDWHINERVINSITSADASILITKTNYQESYYKKNSEGDLVTDQYNSTIKTYNNIFYAGDNDEIHGYDLSNDFDSFPELITNSIWLLKVTNRTYTQGSWRTNEYTSPICLFKEQEEKLKHDYAKLLKHKEKAKKDRLLKDVEQVVIPYLENEEFKDFQLVSGLPWEEECLKEMEKQLKYLYYLLEDYRTKKRNCSFKQALEDDYFLKDIYLTVNSIVNIDIKVKELLANTIVKKYCAKQKITDSKTTYKLITYFTKLPLSELMTCNKKINSKLYGHRYISKMLQFNEQKKI